MSVLDYLRKYGGATEKELSKVFKKPVGKILKYYTQQGLVRISVMGGWSINTFDHIKDLSYRRVKVYTGEGVGTRPTTYPKFTYYIAI